MEPLTALGLASNVLSFVTFASGLVKGTLEISASASGIPKDVERLDSVYQQLQALCNGLQACTEYRIPQARATYEGVDDSEVIAKTFDGVKILCTACKGDADKLLAITKELRTKNGSKRKWDSFRIALKKAWEQSGIEELESRLSQTQITMTLHICTLVNYSSRVQLKQVEGLQQRSLVLQADQGRAIGRISVGIDDLKRTLRSGPDAGCSQQQRSLFTASDVDCLQEKLQSLYLSQLDVQRQQTIMESLTFESRQIRHSQIQAAHEKTFQWVLKTDQSSTHESSLGDWLRNGDGIFWVSGKPGSGKSTLMKYVGASSITRRFDRAHMRQEVEKHRVCGFLVVGGASRGLRTVVARDRGGLNLCIIIDGLDEYSGDHEEQTQLCRALKSLATSPFVKLCLASRPWNIFEEEFGLSYPKIYMQDLTRHDIEKYALSKLKEHSRWATVSAKHSQGQWLISEIVAKSSGVFLWVVLVIKLLRQGLTNRDTFADMRRRLESFPTELEPFFRLMLEAVEPFYHSHMSTALQIANASTASHTNFLIYHFHFQEYEDRDCAVQYPIRPMDKDELEEIRSNTSWQLDSRTRGLLEIDLKDGNVAFLHRTVKDFLDTPEIHEFLANKADPGFGFRPMLSILRAHLGTIKVSSLPTRLQRKGFGVFEADDACGHNFLRLVNRVMECARQLDSDMAGDVRYYALMDELDRTLICMLSRDSCMIGSGPSSNAKQVFFRELLVQWKLFDYLRWKLNSEPLFLKAVGSLPVQRFIFDDDHTDNRFRLHRGHGTGVLASILDQQGIDPNKYDGDPSDSPWCRVFEYICTRWLTQRQSATDLLSFLLEERILKLFLKAGADPNLLIFGSSPVSRTSSSRSAAIFYLEFCFEVLEQSPAIQSCYLDVLSDVLRLCGDEVLKQGSDEFCMTLRNKDKEELHWNLPLFAGVIKMLRLSLGARNPGHEESLQALDETGRKVFPFHLYTPMDVAKVSRGREEKQESGRNRRRRNRR